jgi:hypothetical protein
MAGNTIGEAWVAIRPDITGFTAELMSSVTAAMSQAQAQANAHPINFRASLDTAAASIGRAAARRR